MLVARAMTPVFAVGLVLESVPMLVGSLFVGLLTQKMIIVHNPWVLLFSSAQIRAYVSNVCWNTPVPAYLKL